MLNLLIIAINVLSVTQSSPMLWLHAVPPDLTEGRARVLLFIDLGQLFL